MFRLKMWNLTRHTQSGNMFPSIATAFEKSYKSPTGMFVNGKTLQSQEITTKRDPLAMSINGIAISPLIELVQEPKSLKSLETGMTMMIALPVAWTT